MYAHGGTGKREPAAREADFAAEKKKDLEESIRAEKKNRAIKSRCLEVRRRKAKTKRKEAKGNGKSVRPQEAVRGECQKGRVKGSPKALQRSVKDRKRCVLMEAQERETPRPGRRISPRKRRRIWKRA